METRQEADGLQGRHLQLIFHLHFLRQESGTTNLLFILPEAGDRWTLGYAFTTSHLSTLQDRNNNRHKANNWYLSSVNLLNTSKERIKRQAKSCLGKGPRGHILPILGVRKASITHEQRSPTLDQKGTGCQTIISLDNLPTMPCSGIHLDQNMQTQIREDPGSGQV